MPSHVLRVPDIPHVYDHANCFEHNTLQFAATMGYHLTICMQGPMTEAMESDVLEEDGEVVVRMSTGNWYFLREDPDNSRAFILEGGFGDRYRLQTDKSVWAPVLQNARCIAYQDRLCMLCSRPANTIMLV